MGHWVIGLLLSLVIALLLVVGVAYGVVSSGFLGAYGCSSRDHARAEQLAADKALTALPSTYHEAPKLHTGCDDDDRIASADLELHVGGPKETGSRPIEATLIEHGWRRADYQPDGGAYLASCLTKLIGGKVAEAEVTYESEYRTDRSSDFQVSLNSPPWSTCGEPVDKSCSRPTSLADRRSVRSVAKARSTQRARERGAGNRQIRALIAADPRARSTDQACGRTDRARRRRPSRHRRSKDRAPPL